MFTSHYLKVRFAGVLVRASTTVIKHQEQSQPKEGSIYFNSQLIVHDCGSHRSETQPRTDAACWLAPCDLLCLLSYTIQDQLPRCGTVPSGLGPCTSIMNQENAPPTDLLPGSYRGTFSIEPLFPNKSGLCWACVVLVRQTNQRLGYTIHLASLPWSILTTLHSN